MLLMIDNYDSFTYNVVQYFIELDAQVKVIRNDELSVDEIIALNPARIAISPGPGTPNDAGVSIPVIEYFKDKVPILGICLGHQSIGQAFGGDVIRAKKVMHGKVSNIYHANKGVFTDLNVPFTATRYHSLILNKYTLPDELEVTAWTQTVEGEVDEVMGVRHRKWPIEGVQFHPESIMSEHGHQLLQNFLAL